MDLMRCRHRISKFLLRREIYYPHPGNAWTGRHRDWLSGLRFTDRASELVLGDYLHAHDAMLARRDLLERALGEIAEASPWAQAIGRLRCLRGRGCAVFRVSGLCCHWGMRSSKWMRKTAMARVQL